MNDVLATLGSMIVPFIGITFGLVEFVKAQLHLQGESATWASFIIGAISAAMVYVAFAFPDWGQYVTGVYFVISIGLSASGFYKFVDSRTTRNGGAG